MVIQHNMTAANTNRMLGNIVSNQAKSTEKLSSGYRINRAADDAAGLSISEKMRSQIRGLDQASTNAQDGISLIQTAEGGLNETHSILQRMRELAVQASTGTETDADRVSVQEEMGQLQDELTRIADTTEFNTMKLLDGSLGGPKGLSTTNNSTIGGQIAKLTVGKFSASAGSTAAFSLTAFGEATVKIDGVNINVDFSILTDEEKNALRVDWTSNTSESVAKKAAGILEKTINNAIDSSGLGVDHITVKASANTGGSTYGGFTFNSGSKGKDSVVSAAGTTGTILNTMFTGGTSTAGETTYNSEKVTANSTMTLKINGESMIIKMSGADSGITAGDKMTAVADSLKKAINSAFSKYNSGRDSDYKLKDVAVTVSTDGRLVVTSESGVVSFEDIGVGETAKSMGLSESATKTGANGGMTLQIGANKNQTINFGIDAMNAEALGVGKGRVNANTQTAAQKSIEYIDDAIAKVSNQRSKMGAIQNRLEHTISNLDNTAENLQTAESNIRDVDMAAEMVNYSKNSILQQAAQSMLAQANQANQGVLSLLQ